MLSHKTKGQKKLTKTLSTMSTLMQPASKAHRRAVRVRRARPHRTPRTPLERNATLALEQRPQMSQAQRIRVHTQAVAKLSVKPNMGLETQWGDLPIELVEMTALHLHPTDLARLRRVSSGWRAALWQERVVRASLRGIGTRISEMLLRRMLRASDHATDAILDLTDNPWAKDRSSLMIAWEPILDRMIKRHGSWDEFIKDNTRNAVVEMWLGTMPPLSPHLHVEERARKRGAEWKALLKLARKGFVALC